MKCVGVVCDSGDCVSVSVCVAGEEGGEVCSMRGGSGGGSGGGVSCCLMERMDDLRRRFEGVVFVFGVSFSFELVEVEVLGFGDKGAEGTDVCRSSAPEGGVSACESEREYVDIGVGGLSSLLLERETAVSSECILRCPVSSQRPECSRGKSGLAGGLPSSGLSS